MRRCAFAVAAVALALALAPAANAALIDFAYAQPIGAHWDQAGTSPNWYWSDHLAPQPGNDYRVGSPAVGGNLRTPEGFSDAFNGDSLILRPGGALLLKANASGRVYTVLDLLLDGGAITHGSDNQTITLDGNITVLSTSSIGVGDPNPRRLNLDAQLHGSAQLNISIGQDDWITLRDDNSDYSGTWNLSRISSASNAYLDAQAVGSLGTGDIIVNTGLLLDIDYDRWVGTSNLTLNGVLTLDQDHWFNSVTIGGTSLGPGLYTFDWLNTHFDTYFTNGGTGSLLVAPEPATLSLLALGALGLLRRRRRSA